MVDQIKSRGGFETPPNVAKLLRDNQRKEQTAGPAAAQQADTAVRVATNAQATQPKGARVTGELKDALTLSNKALDALKRAAAGIEPDGDFDVESAETLANDLAQIRDTIGSHVDGLKKTIVTAAVLRENIDSSRSRIEDVDAYVEGISSKIQFGGEDQARQALSAHLLTPDRVTSLLAD